MAFRKSVQSLKRLALRIVSHGDYVDDGNLPSELWDMVKYKRRPLSDKYEEKLLHHIEKNNGGVIGLYLSNGDSFGTIMFSEIIPFMIVQLYTSNMPSTVPHEGTGYCFVNNQYTRQLAEFLEQLTLEHGLIVR